MAVAEREILSQHPQLVVLKGRRDFYAREPGRVQRGMLLFSAVRNKVVRENGYKNPDGSFHQGFYLAPEEIENRLREIAEKKIFGVRKTNRITTRTQFEGKEAITVYEIDSRSIKRRKADLRIIAKACHVQEKRVQRQYQKGRIGDKKFTKQMEAIEGQRLSAQNELFPGVFTSISRNKKLRPKNNYGRRAR